MYISVGCALENLLVAAEHFGYSHKVSYDEEEQAVVVHIGSGGRLSSFRHPELFEAIRVRHTNRKTFQIMPIPSETLRLLQDICIEDGSKVQVTDDLETKEKMVDLILRANNFLFSNPAFRAELVYWHGKGSFGIPWIVSEITQEAVTRVNLGRFKANKDSKAVMSASILAIISSQKDDRAAQVMAGQVLERVWLKATALGISLQPMTNVLKVPDFRTEVANLFPSSDVYPQLIFRLGYAEPAQKRTTRRTLSDFKV